jgi:hypothetical protein
MSHHDPFQTLASTDLDRVSGGAAAPDMSSMLLPMMMMGMNKKSAAPVAAPPPPPPPPKPQIMLNGVLQQPTTGADGALTYNTDSASSSSTV